jgi:Lon protease-like protein
MAVQIPLFPLPNLVVFPNVILPLHIFEERYKEMINTCIDNSSVFGLVLLREGTEESEQTIHRAGTTARVIDVQRLADGRMNIICRGADRFRILHFGAQLPYWTGTVEVFEDTSGNEAAVGPLVEQVRSLYKRAFDLSVRLDIVEAAEVQLPDSPADLSFMIAYALDIDAQEKQKLLETRSTEERLRALSLHLDESVRKLEQQLVHLKIAAKVRGNGDLGLPKSGA